MAEVKKDGLPASIGDTEEGGNYVIVAPDKEGNLIPFGKLQDESKEFMAIWHGEAVTVTNGFYYQ